MNIVLLKIIHFGGSVFKSNLSHMGFKNVVLAIVASSTMAFSANALNGKHFMVQDPTGSAPCLSNNWGCDAGTGSLSNGWYHIVAASLPDYATSVKVVQPGGAGSYTNLHSGVSLSTFAGKDTVYIFKSGSNWVASGNKPKTILFLNPWVLGAPQIQYGTTTVNMQNIPSRCGWFAYTTSDFAINNILFVDVNSKEQYGNQGLGDVVSIDISKYFPASDTTFVYPANASQGGPALITDINPNVAGECLYNMGMVIRDFRSSHPDFSGIVNNSAAKSGIVQNDLGTDGKPVWNTSSANNSFCNISKFDDWFNSKPSVSYETCIDVPMRKTDDGLWAYNSLDALDANDFDHSFFPIDTLSCSNQANPPAGCTPKSEFANSQYVRDIVNWSGIENGTKPHNFLFCMEGHASFKYQPPADPTKKILYEFSGDDDVWIYIDKKLQLDLGCRHSEVAGTIDITKLATDNKWDVDSDHSFDIFYCERQATGSNLKMKTSLYLKQKRGLFFDVTTNADGSQSYVWKKLQGADQSCSGLKTGSTEVVENADLFYVLTGGALTKPETLSVGVHYSGIKIISANEYSLNKSAIKGLGPGRYTLTAVQKNQLNLQSSIQFTVVGTIALLNTQATEILAGKAVMLEVGNVLEGKPVAGADPYTISYPSGVKVFYDANMTQPIDPQALKLNDNGLDTLWATMPRSIKTTTVANLQVGSGSKKVTYVIPKLRFTQDSLATAQFAYLQYGMIVEAYTDQWGVCNDCVGDTLSLYQDSLLVIRNSPSGASVKSLVLDAQGKAPFWVSAIRATTNSWFGIEANVYLDAVDPAPHKVRESYIEKLSINLKNPPVPLLTKQEVYDTNGDGIADKLFLEFDTDLLNPKDSLPEQLTYQWPAGSGKSVSLTKQAFGDLMKAGGNGKSIAFVGHLTDTIKTEGSGIVSYDYIYQGIRFPLTFELSDKVGPVIKRAEISLASTEDKIKLYFSEKVSDLDVQNDKILFEFKKGNNVVNLAYTFKTFADSGRIAMISFPANADFSAKVIPGDSIRIRVDAVNSGGLIHDLFGNYASPNSIYRVFSGAKRVVVQTVKMQEVNHSILATKKIEGCDITKDPACIIALTPGTKVVDIVNEKGRQGFLLPFEVIGNLTSTGTEVINPKDIQINLEANWFSHQGTVVNQLTRMISCDDPKVFGGNCNSNPKDLFIAWNYKSVDGTPVGSGVYVANLKWSVTVKGTKPGDGKGEKLERWGVRVIDGTPAVLK